MKAYLIPGSGEDLKSRNYGLILDIYRQHGYEPEFLPITWKYRTISQWVEEIEHKLSKSDIQDSLLSGFSFGAMIALAVAAKTSPKTLLLFSLSPYFKEDMPLPHSHAVWTGKRRVADFQKLSFDQLAQQIHCPTTFFLGSIEKEKYGDKRSSEARGKINGSKLVIATGAGHDITHPGYQAAIKRALERL